jgi:hypothetical protein
MPSSRELTVPPMRPGELPSEYVERILAEWSGQPPEPQPEWVPFAEWDGDVPVPYKEPEEK